MIENGFYKIKPEFIGLIKNLGGKYSDNKQRPIFCCIEDKYINNLYWAIPTSDLSHRTENQVEKVNKWCNENSIRSNYYHIGYTNRPALYKISNCFPITEKYIDCEYYSQGQHLKLKNKKEIAIIQKKLSRILFDESIHPNKYEQHITVIKNYLSNELQQSLTRENTPINDFLIKLNAKEKEKSVNNEIER